MKYAVVTICRKDSDKFEGQSKGSTGWFNLDFEFLKYISTLKPDLYKTLMKSIFKVRTWDCKKRVSYPLNILS